MLSRQPIGRRRTWSAVIGAGRPNRRCRARPAGLPARYLRGRGLKAESGLVVLKENTFAERKGPLLKMMAPALPSANNSRVFLVSRGATELARLADKIRS